MRALGRGAARAARLRAGIWAAPHAAAAWCTPQRARRAAAAAAGQGGAPPQAAGGVAHEETITSTANAFVKHCVKLRERARYRREQGRLLLVGATIIRELSEGGAPLDISTLLLQPGAPSPLPPHLLPGRVVRVTEAVAKKISGLETVSPSDVMAELDMTNHRLMSAAELRAAFGVGAAAGGGEQRQQQQEQQQQQQAEQQQGGEGRRGDAPRGGRRRLRRLLALEAVQDPGNLGTLLRCAMAFGWDAVLLLPGCCDPLNEKALRASRGAALRMALAEGSWDELAALAADARLALLAAEPGEDSQAEAEESGGGSRRRAEAEREAGKDAGVCLVLGSEGQGLSETALRRCRPVGIPMVGDMESLNVSVAGGILMFVLSEGLHPLMRNVEGLVGDSGGSGGGGSWPGGGS